MARGFRLAVVTRKAVVQVYRRRQVIHFIFRRHGDLKYVGVVPRAIENYGQLSRLFGFEKAAPLNPNQARPHQQQVSCRFRIALQRHRVAQPERLACILQVRHSSLGNGKIGQRLSQQRFDDLYTVFVHRNGFHTGSFRGSQVAHSALFEVAGKVPLRKKVADAVRKTPFMRASSFGNWYSSPPSGPTSKPSFSCNAPLNWPKGINSSVGSKNSNFPSFGCCTVATRRESFTPSGSLIAIIT